MTRSSPDERLGDAASSSPRRDSEARYRAIIATARERGAVRSELKYQRIDGSRPWAMLELNSSPPDHRRPDCMRAMFTDVRPSIALGLAAGRHA